MAFFSLFRRARINTRAYQRLPAAWPIRCEPQTEADGRHLTSTGDVSAGGVAVAVPQEIPVGTKIRLEICVAPIGRSIRALGLVVRCAPTAGGRFSLGIRYIEIGPQDRIALNEAIEAHYQPHRYGRPWWRALFCAALILALCPDSWGYQPVLSDEEVTLPKKEIQKIAETIEEEETLLEFFKRRTHLAVGFDQVYNSNILLQDNAKRKDYITTLEGLLLFADPRGSILYGTRYEVAAYRYLRSDANAIDHDFLAFFDFDPGGRVQLHTDYLLLANNRLLFGAVGSDILRRSSDFQRSVEHAWTAKLRYALNETNTLVPSMEYSLFDDQAVSDASSDRKRFRAILDMDHDLTPTWTVFGGYSFRDIFVGGDKPKSSETHGARLGVRHEVSEEEKLEVTLEFQRHEFKNKQTARDLGFSGTWTHEVGPRTTVKLRYSDQRDTSFSAGRLRYRDRSPSLEILCELSSLLQLIAKASYNKQTSGQSDTISGSSASSEKNTQYAMETGLKWQFREEAYATLDYTYSRSTTRDFTSHVVSVGVEALF